MDLYLLSLLLGGAGLAAMALSGVGRHGSAHSSAHGHAHSSGHAGAPAHGTSAGHAHSSGHAGAPAHGTSSGHAHVTATHQVPSRLWALASPRVLFSLLLGFGTTGLVLRPTMGGLVLGAVAVVGGILFERLLVTPVWNLAFRFASNPAVTLESTVTDEAVAVTAFDASGHGIVSIEVDGQVVQILGTLRADDRVIGGTVRAGQRVRIEEVDTARNRCTVSLL
jgi:hypothetical protein